MSFQTSEPLPPEDSGISAARRRRKRRTLLSASDGEQAEYLEELARQTTPSVDFFVFPLLAGLILALAMVTGHQVLFLLAVVTVPFLAPLAGLSLSTVVGSARFFALNLGSLVLGAFLIFIGGLLGGWIFSFLGEPQLEAAVYPARFSTIDVLVLTLAAGLATYSLARAPQRKPALIGALLTYEIFIPLGAAGYGLSSGISGMASHGISVFVAHTAWAALVGTLLLAAYGVKPGGTLTYAMGAILAFISLALFIPNLGAQPEAQTLTPAHGTTVVENNDGTALAATPVRSHTPQPTATVTYTLTPLPTSTITPTMTNTVTPTSVFALVAVKEGHGAIIRAEADPDSEMVATPLNETLVEVFEVKIVGSVTWAHVRLIQDGDEVVGWIMRGLIATATPGAGELQ